MKRHGEDGDGMQYGNNPSFPNKRVRSEGGYAEALAAGKFEFRLLVCSKAAGAVIGKGGENIKRLRANFDAVVSIPDSTSPERVLTVVAEPNNLVDLCKDLLPRLDDGSGDSKQEIRMIVHQSHAGAIIGRQGAKIKELREETHANLKVFSQCCPQSTDRVVLVGGGEQPILDAIRVLINMLKEIPIKGSSKQYDTACYDPTYINDYGGHAPDARMMRGGPGGMPLRGGPGGPGGPYGGPMGPRGSPRSMGGPPPFAQGPPHSMAPQMAGPPQQLGAPYGAAPFPGQPPVQTTQVTIPSELGGTIIGRGGERINRIRGESGAHIVLEPPANGADERIITITGTQGQIHTAQYLLQQCVRSSLAGRNGNGRDGGYNQH